MYDRQDYEVLVVQPHSGVMTVNEGSNNITIFSRTVCSSELMFGATEFQ